MPSISFVLVRCSSSSLSRAFFFSPDVSSFSVREAAVCDARASRSSAFPGRGLCSRNSLSPLSSTSRAVMSLFFCCICLLSPYSFTLSESASCWRLSASSSCSLPRVSRTAASLKVFFFSFAPSLTVSNSRLDASYFAFASSNRFCPVSFSCILPFSAVSSFSTRSFSV